MLQEEWKTNLLGKKFTDTSGRYRDVCLEESGIPDGSDIHKLLYQGKVAWTEEENGMTPSRPTCPSTLPSGRGTTREAQKPTAPCASKWTRATSKRCSRMANSSSGIWTEPFSMRGIPTDQPQRPPQSNKDKQPPFQPENRVKGGAWSM